MKSQKELWAEEKTCFSCIYIEEMHGFLRKYRFEHLKEQVEKCLNCRINNPGAKEIHWEEY